MAKSTPRPLRSAMPLEHTDRKSKVCLCSWKQAPTHEEIKAQDLHLQSFRFCGIKVATDAFTTHKILVFTTAKRGQCEGPLVLTPH